MPQMVRPDGSNAEVPALDVREAHGLPLLAPPCQGCSFAHHVFAARVDGARWVRFDTSSLVTGEELNLAASAVGPRGHNAPASAEWRPLLTFDANVSVEELLAARARCQRLPAMLGRTGPIGAALAVGGWPWLVSEPSYARFGTEVPEDALGRGEVVMIREADGLFHFDDGAGDGIRWTPMLRVVRLDTDAWLDSDRHIMEDNESLTVFAKRAQAPTDAGGSPNVPDSQNPKGKSKSGKGGNARTTGAK